MKKRIKVKEHMTGRELAAILHRSKLRWNNGAVIQNEGGGHHSYCMIRQLARLAGVSNTTLKNVGEGEAPSIIPDTNDKNNTKADCVQAFCDLGERTIPVAAWIEDMLEQQKANGW